ncbi:MAG: hypothetical protein ACFE0R_20435 [Salinarimonas sp.]
MTFPVSAEILGEAIRALVDSGRVARNDLAGNVIVAGVRSAIAARLWNETGTCDRNRVRAADIAAAEAAVPGSSRFAWGTVSLPAIPPDRQLPTARVVSRIAF